MDLLDAILQRWVVILLAVTGGITATVGSLLQRKGVLVNPRLAKLVTRLGYAITWISVGIFIVMGFRG
jgi:hypothetical protein